MKTISVVFAVITMFSASAMATSNGPSKGGDSTSNSTAISGAASNSKADARAASTSKSSSKSKSKSSATGGNAAAAGGTGGNSAGGSAVASIAPMSFSFTAPATPSASFVQHDYGGLARQAPAMGNSYITTSNTCDGATGLGFVFPGGGVNLSGSTLRMMCEGRLNAQAYNTLGEQEKAKKVLRVVDEYACSQDEVWAKIARAEGLCKPEEKTESNAQPASSWLGSN